MEKPPAELIHAIGTLFGESKRIDNNIVERSKDLFGTSDLIQKTLEQTISTIKAPSAPAPAPAQATFHQSPFVVDNMKDYYTVPEPVMGVGSSTVLPVDNTTQTFWVLKSIDTKLQLIIDILTAKNNASKPRKRKPRKIPTKS
jgi:hypothetical protein